ncbi:hypothetical protein HYN48_00220 [Flavobacterium magnum]|uniref:Polysaccharide (De)acetylase n=1 Tax=Flavobacterium magnum TaxID=2162713 RepID=A0A2S0RBH3_9FLAO|nr:hypothetical protein [Flavobacterium magnum]AWA28630.1 hypothetical protein HYN48_00220 [Flavobacterium magnum]
MSLKNLKQALANNMKNIRGWKTDRKIVVISVDDYGNVKVDSKEAIEQMEKEGVKPLSHFDIHDTLETGDDLQQLFEVLSSVKDRHGNPAVFTAFSLPVNIDFDKMKANNYEKYEYELLPETFAKRKGYENVWALWQEGMRKKLIVPQFHGREHLNLKIFNDALKNRDKATLVALKNRSYTSISLKNYPSYTAAFDFSDFSEFESHNEIIADGLNAFEKVFGFRATHFNAPGGRENAVLHKALKENGVLYIDTPFDKKEHLGGGKFKRVFNYTGKQNEHGQTFMVRNVVFEPIWKRGYDPVEHALKQVEAAFRWNKPAIISSHRVNYSGLVDPKNRENGLGALKKLLSEITKRWPDVEFMAANELAEQIAASKK